jgi:hypothetical protein
LTCTYTSSESVLGTGNLLLYGPSTSISDTEFDDAYVGVLHYWDGGTGDKHSPMLQSGVPVTFTQTLNAPGYYKFQWQCRGGEVDGAYTEVIVRVVATPEELPEAPPVAAIVACFAAVGAVGLVTAKKTSFPSKIF